MELSIEQRLINFVKQDNENNINKWLKDTNNLIKDANDDEKEILEDLKKIILNSVISYLDEEIPIDANEVTKVNAIMNGVGKNIKLLQELNEKEEGKLKKDIMFEIQNNFPRSEYIQKQYQKNVLNLSINPGNSQKDYQKENTFNNRNKNVPLMYSIDTKSIEKVNKNLAAEIEKIKNKIKRIYIWPSYYDRNFEIFNKITPKPKYYWIALPHDTLINYFEMMNYNSKGEKLNKIELTKKDMEYLKEMITIEKKDVDYNTPLVYFNDLFWIADSNQKQLLEIINKYYKKNSGKKEIDTYSKKILDLYIDKYKPKMIVITDVKAAKFIIDAIKSSKDENEIKKMEKSIENNAMFYYKGIPVILSGYIVGGMDNYTITRLTNDIARIWKDNI